MESEDGATDPPNLKNTSAQRRSLYPEEHHSAYLQRCVPERFRSHWAIKRLVKVIQWCLLCHPQSRPNVMAIIDACTDVCSRIEGLVPGLEGVDAELDVAAQEGRNTVATALGRPLKSLLHPGAAAPAAGAPDSAAWLEDWNHARLNFYFYRDFQGTADALLKVSEANEDLTGVDLQEVLAMGQCAAIDDAVPAAVDCVDVHQSAPDAPDVFHLVSEPGLHKVVLLLVEDALGAGASELCKLMQRLATTDDNGHSPVHRAVADDLRALANMFMRAGADPNQADAWGMRPIMLCQSSAMLKLLLRHNAQLDVKDATGASPLMHAANKPDAWLVSTMLQTCPAMLNQADDSGRTPLFEACTNPHNDDALKLLLRNRPRLDAADAFGDTALNIACESGNLTRIQLLLDAKAPLNGTQNSPLLSVLASGLDHQQLQQLLDKLVRAGAVFGDGPWLKTVPASALHVLSRVAWPTARGWAQCLVFLQSQHAVAPPVLPLHALCTASHVQRRGTAQPADVVAELQERYPAQFVAMARRKDARGNSALAVACRRSTGSATAKATIMALLAVAVPAFRWAVGTRELCSAAVDDNVELLAQLLPLVAPRVKTEAIVTAAAEAEATGSANAAAYLQSFR